MPSGAPDNKQGAGRKEECWKIICTYLESPVFRLNHIPLNLSCPPQLKNPFQIISLGPSAPFDEFQSLEHAERENPNSSCRRVCVELLLVVSCCQQLNDRWSWVVTLIAVEGQQCDHTSHTLLILEQGLP